MKATKKKLGLCTQSYKGKNEHFVGSYKENLDTLLVTYKENFGLGQTLGLPNNIEGKVFQ